MDQSIRRGDKTVSEDKQMSKIFLYARSVSLVHACPFRQMINAALYTKASLLQDCSLFSMIESNEVLLHILEVCTTDDPILPKGLFRDNEKRFTACIAEKCHTISINYISA